MKNIRLPVEELSVGGVVFSAVSLIRNYVMTLEFWREGQSVDRVLAHLEIENRLDCVSEGKMILSDRHHELLASAMELKGKTILESQVQRLYMKTYAAVLQAENDLPVT